METLVILSPGFAADENDTTCLPTVQQFILSVKKLYPSLKIIIIAFQYPYVKSTYMWHGVEVIAMGNENRGGIYRMLNWVRVYKQLSILYKQNQQMGLLSFWLTECSLITQRFAQNYKIPYFMWLQGQDAKKENKYMQRIKPSTEHLIAISDFIAKECFKNHHLKVKHIIENGVNTALFPAFNQGLRDIDILGVGSLTEVKNYALFITIVAVIKNHFPEVKVILVGSGNLEQELKDLAKESGLSDNIHFASTLPHVTVLELMNRTKLFLHTAHFEGTPAVSIEALYSGCYVYSTLALADRPISNHKVLKDPSDFIHHMCNQLKDSKRLQHERVLVNSMDHSAQRMMQLFAIS
jgi:glycosyltransferase involved in cell wall biosynthesis